MTENMKIFLELASKEGKNYIEEFKKADKDGIIALAAEKGIALTDEDFPQSGAEGEVSLDEADAVAGGKKCYCAVGGGGEASGENDETCACVGAGFGMGYIRNDYYAVGDYRCVCVAGGYGDTNN